MTDQGPPPIEATQTGQKHKPRIMAVDDQPDSLRLLQLRVQAGGMECVIFQDGEAALKYVACNSVDVIILDVMMPGLDGFEVCRRLKSSDNAKDIPVIFLTAKMDPTDKIRGLEVGGHDYLSKPVEQQELVARTRAALRVKMLQDELKGKLRLQQQISQLHQGMLSSHWLNTFGQLASSLAHEINNPLAAALGGIQLLGMSDALPESAQGSIRLIDHSLQRAGQKLRSLLMIAHTQQTPYEADLATLLTDLITVVNFQLVMNKISLQLNLQEGCLWTGQMSEVGRAILYVLNNAIEAVSGVNEPTIWLALKASENLLEITVADNGVGISDQHLPRVFEPFFTTKGPPHSGLGLHLAERILRKAGGAIQVDKSSSDGRTEFLIRLFTGAAPKS